MKMYFVRHGETDWNVNKKIQGSADIPLNEKGRRQAEELAAQLVKQRRAGEFQAVRVYTSPQLRAAETAETVAEALGIACIPLDGLREMSMGKWEGISWNRVREEFPGEFRAWNRHRRYRKTPEGESYQDVISRAFDAIACILEQEKEDVLVVTHSAVLMAVRCYMDNCPFKEREMLGRYSAHNTEVVELSGEELAEAVKRFREEELA